MSIGFDAIGFAAIAGEGLGAGEEVAESQDITQSSRFDNAQTFFGGAVTTTITVNQSTRFDNTNTFYGGVVTLSGGPQTIPQDSRFNNVNTFYGGAITTAITVNQSARFNNTNTFYGGTVSSVGGSQSVTQSARFDNVNTFFGGVITQSGGVQSITQATRFDNQNVFFGGSLSGGVQSSGPGYEWVYLEPRQWWKRKPKDLPIAKAKTKIRRVAKVLDDVAEQQVKAGNVTQASIVDRIRPLIEQMPGFDWRPLYQAILEIRQAEIAKQQADMAVQDAIRRAMEQDEEDIAILLLSM
jgi:hypothetical protein